VRVRVPVRPSAKQVRACEVTPRFLNTLGSYFGLEFPPGSGRHVSRVVSAVGFIVVLNPRRDRCLRFLVGFETMLLDALELERAHE
jgi:hypothetical protein